MNISNGERKMRYDKVIEKIQKLIIWYIIEKNNLNSW